MKNRICETIPGFLSERRWILDRIQWDSETTKLLTITSDFYHLKIGCEDWLQETDTSDPYTEIRFDDEQEIDQEL